MILTTCFGQCTTWDYVIGAGRIAIAIFQIVASAVILFYLLKFAFEDKKEKKKK